MSPNAMRVAVISAFFIIASAVVPSAKAAPTDDACALLTPAQVSAAAGVPMKDGQYVTPTKKETCTWTAAKPAEKSTKIVTLFLEGLPMFQASKKPLVNTITVTPVSGLGDEAYYVTMTTNIMLHVKKGNFVFRVTVYADLPAETKQSIEKTLALQIVAKL